ncbi:NAD-dependent epimerase/dehydratase family protein [Aeromicrobium camelliae]|uniref:NAD-dependent epimerase/dehydratase family protein n=1 Tax=Aeromicrobium camelliae TaxID=1538144 RepID=A0A3N6W3K4_9ACTN|nr:NAD-dependent epimerase/dehydratase family protein [Aeromicrobium camelliae]RQN02109.1 NAD-dependent epimerase/dehydratase family protein [Aeromicrobium camelliae]
MSRVVLVTGVADGAVARTARLIADRGVEVGIEKVVGVDTTLPTHELGKVKFIRADVRTPVIGKVLAVEDVDTVVHLGVAPASSRFKSTKELNVIGTMQVLAACQRSETLRKFVLGSSTAVYGTSPRDPAVWTESGTARGGTRSGYPKDVVEVEGYVRGFARRRPDVIVTTLRMAQILSPRSTAPLAAYFRGPVLPGVLGFDPRLQFLHLADAMEVVRLAAAHDRPGTFNIAGDGVMLLSQCARILGRPVAPLPPVALGAAFARFARVMGTEISPDLHRLLTYGRVVDTTALRHIFGYEPRHTTRETFESFAAALRPGLLHLGVPR